ncbi:hypothetical protein Pmani_024218 [Petrolisthes manimaculis]|uniref:RCC1-like domain-containing protein n=1 Tax=Petrolisthes manimaculis TaxID=1843537 RepID=A0AAE1U2H3_9EUCA|nr:hypothetical protein Pmani_024218 [Petrolisthes manimaculis]
MVRPTRSVAPQAVQVNGVSEPHVAKGRGRKRTKDTDEPSKAKKVKVQLEAPQVTGGVILTVGMGDIGQLGLGPDVEEKSLPAVVPSLTDIVAVAAGGLHTVCIDKAGKVRTWGCNDEGALGRLTPNEEDAFTSGTVDVPGKVVQICAGDCHTAALTDDGTVYAWGCFRDNSGPLGFLEDGVLQKTPIKLTTDAPVVKISSGNNHLVLLTKDGRVLTCGCGESGQLGRIAEVFATRDSRNGKGIETQLQLYPIKVYKRRKAVVFDAVWAGGMTTFVRAEGTGDIYGFGLNNYNQLGHEDTSTKFQPVLIKGFSGKTWKQISGGQHHSLALTEDGEVHSMGRREYGRLGMGDIKGDMLVPTPIPSLVKEKGVVISAGECVSIVVTESGSAYGFGMGTNQQLGQGNDDDQLEPKVVRGKQLAERRVLVACAGGQHTVLLCVPK